MYNENESAYRRMLSKLIIIKSDLGNVNPEDFEGEIKRKIIEINNDVKFLVEKLIDLLERK